MVLFSALHRAVFLPISPFGEFSAALWTNRFLFFIDLTFYLQSILQTFVLGSAKPIGNAKPTAARNVCKALKTR
jgi:hypothetical protein